MVRFGSWLRTPLTPSQWLCKITLRTHFHWMDRKLDNQFAHCIPFLIYLFPIADLYDIDYTLCESGHFVCSTLHSRLLSSLWQMCRRSVQNQTSPKNGLASFFTDDETIAKIAKNGPFSLTPTARLNRRHDDCAKLLRYREFANRFAYREWIDEIKERVIQLSEFSIAFRRGRSSHGNSSGKRERDRGSHFLNASACTVQKHFHRKSRYDGNFTISCIDGRRVNSACVRNGQSRPSTSVLTIIDGYTPMAIQKAALDRQRRVNLRATDEHPRHVSQPMIDDGFFF